MDRRVDTMPAPPPDATPPPTTTEDRQRAELLDSRVREEVRAKDAADREAVRFLVEPLTRALSDLYWSKGIDAVWAAVARIKAMDSARGRSLEWFICDWMPPFGASRD